RLDRHRPLGVLELLGERPPLVGLEEVPERDVHPLTDGGDGQNDVTKPRAHTRPRSRWLESSCETQITIGPRHPATRRLRAAGTGLRLVLLWCRRPACTPDAGGTPAPQTETRPRAE